MEALAGTDQFTLAVPAGAAGTRAGGARAGAAEGEVIAALQALGYTPAEAREAARTASDEASAEASLEEKVKTALRGLAKGERRST